MLEELGGGQSLHLGQVPDRVAADEPLQQRNRLGQTLGVRFVDAGRRRRQRRRRRRGRRRRRRRRRRHQVGARRVARRRRRADAQIVQDRVQVRGETVQHLRRKKQIKIDDRSTSMAPTLSYFENNRAIELPLMATPVQKNGMNGT